MIHCDVLRREFPESTPSRSSCAPTERRYPAVIWILALGWLTPAAAQEPAPPSDPFGEVTKSDSAAKPPAAKKEAAAAAVETDPHVLAIRNSKPQTAFDLARAVDNLMKLGRPDEAKKYLKVLADAKLDDATLWWLQKKFGSALFMRWSREESMQPEGHAFAASVLEAARNMVREPARLEATIKQLSDAAPEVRYAAVSDLREAGEDAAVALIAVLADPSRAAEHSRIRAALVQLGSVAEKPSLAVMDSSDEAARTNALLVLAQLGSRDALPFMLRPILTESAESPVRRVIENSLGDLAGRAINSQQAERYLRQQAIAYFDGKSFGRPDHEDLVQLWRWGETERRPAAARVTPRLASLRMAGRIAAELVRLNPANVEHRKLYAAALLESARSSLDWSQPLERGEGTPFHFASQLGVSALEDVVQFSLDRGHTGAAVAALEIMGEIGDVRLLLRSDGYLSAPCRALRHADRRVRFAAMQAVLRIDPRERFHGASFVTESLGYFASHSGARRALVVHPRTELAQTLAGTLNGSGFQADTVATGGEAVQLATRNSDYEFVLVSDAIDRPQARELLQLLRREPRTANLPVAILAREENLERMQLTAEEDPLAISMPAPYEPSAMGFLVGRLRQLAGTSYVSQEERLRHASAALERMAALAAKPEWYAFYELASQQDAVERALSAAPLRIRAIRVLGLLGTPSAQRRLVNLANQSDSMLHDRRAAAAAFEIAVRRQGLLLTRSEILTQYDRYNASVNSDQGTQQVLGTILDTMELDAVEASADGEAPAESR
jgi:CheY-like chemotaxis protein